MGKSVARSAALMPKSHVTVDDYLATNTLVVRLLLHAFECMLSLSLTKSNQTNSVGSKITPNMPISFKN